MLSLIDAAKRFTEMENGALRRSAPLPDSERRRNPR